MRKRVFRYTRRGLVGTLVMVMFCAAYLWISTPLPSAEQLRARAALGNTKILDRVGRLLYELPDPLSGRQRPVPLAAMPLALRQATIAVEDGGFYANPGIELRGTLRAALSNLHSGAIVAGGSTITQQLARNFLLEPTLAREQSLERKLREATLALKLTALLPKEEILALYLNQVYYGGLSYGVEAAARHYFDRPVGDLTLAECALLAGLPQAPSRYDPFANPQAALARRATVLDAMARAGYLSPAQAQAAGAEPLRLASSGPPMRAAHFVGYVLGQLSNRLGPEALARGGLVITTTLDLALNEEAELTLRRQLASLSAPRAGQPSHNMHNGAVVVLDPSDGAILAMVGSPDFADRAAGQVNAALALRQPGSAIKPLTYAAALEGGWTPATVILDAPSSFATRSGLPYTPQNYDRTFHGPLSLREALATSSNVAAVKALDFIGVPALLDIASRLGIRSLTQGAGHYGLALTLGGGEVTPLELTAAFAAFANGGRPVPPYAILTVNNQVWERAYRPAETGVSPQIAYLITDILSDPYARMRAFGSRSPLDIDRPAAAKTGTTSDWRDNWTVGYTPDRAVGVWVGNADGTPMQLISGISGAGPVWQAVMLAAHRGLPARAFSRPTGIVEREICADSGLSASTDCSARRIEQFVVGSQPAPAVAAPTAQPALALTAPLNEAAYVIDGLTPRERQRLLIEASASPEPAELRLFVDGALVATLYGPPYRTLWPLAVGEHHVWAELVSHTGELTRSAPISFVVGE